MPARLRWTIIGFVTLVGLRFLNHYAPLEPFSLAFDFALVAFLLGLISLFRPLEFFSIGSRRTALLVIAGSALVGAGALYWPAGVREAASDDKALDRALPFYSVREFHSVRVHAPAIRVNQAMREVTGTDMPLTAVIMQLRMWAGGQFRRVPPSPKPMLEEMARPGSGFIPLYDDGTNEMVFGLAGRFWTSGAHAVTKEQFYAYREPGSAKAVFSMRVVDAGAGWSELTTETRAAGTDDAGRATFARYWRVIYPGSATIRRMMLNAIKERAER